MSKTPLYFYDSEGFLCEESSAAGNTDLAPPESFNRPLFDGEAWIESLINHAWQIDQDGFFVIDLLDYDIREGLPHTRVPCPSGVFRRPQFVAGNWIEGSPKTEAELLSEAKQVALAKITREHQQRIVAGVPFNFGESQDVIQTRFNQDLINISGITTRAMLLQSQGVTDAVMNFRAQSNTTYQITPTQAIALGEAVALHIDGSYQQLWSQKDAIGSATHIQEVEAIAWPA